LNAAQHVPAFPSGTIGISLFGGKGEGEEEVKLKRKALMNRSCVFEYRREEFEWRYGRQDEGRRMNGIRFLFLRRSSWVEG
jgi:hypothetical protein